MMRRITIVGLALTLLAVGGAGAAPDFASLQLQRYQPPKPAPFAVLGRSSRRFSTVANPTATIRVPLVTQRFARSQRFQVRFQVSCVRACRLVDRGADHRAASLAPGVAGVERVIRPSCGSASANSLPLRRPACLRASTYNQSC